MKSDFGLNGKQLTIYWLSRTSSHQQHRHRSSLEIHPYNATEALSFLKQFEGFVNFLEAQFMRYELVQTKFLQHKHTSQGEHYIQIHERVWLPDWCFFFFLNKQLCFKYLPYTFFFPKTCMLLTFGFNLLLVVGLRYYCFVRTFLNFDFESLSPIYLTQIVAEKMDESVGNSLFFKKKFKVPLEMEILATPGNMEI